MESRLYEAAMEGNVPSLLDLLGKDRLLLDRIVTWNQSDTPLHVAVMLGHLRFVEELVLRKAELAEEQDLQGSTALHIAAAKGYFGIVARLLEFGPEVCFVRDKYGRNPLHVAAMKGHKDVLDILMQKRQEAALDTFDDGQTILHGCVKHGRLQCLKLLVNYLQDDQIINSSDINGNTILHLAAIYRQPKIILFLSEIGLDPNLPNSKGLSAFALLAQVEGMKNYSEIVDKTDTAVHLPGGKESEKKRKRKWKKWLESTFNTLLVVAILLAGNANQGGLKPPENIWDIYLNGGNDDKTRKLRNVHRLYLNCNTVSYILALSVVLVLTGLPFKRWTLVRVAMVIAWGAMIFGAVAHAIPYLLFIPDSEGKAAYETVGNSVIGWSIFMGLIAVCHIFSMLKSFCGFLKSSYSALKRRQQHYVTTT